MLLELHRRRMEGDDQTLEVDIKLTIKAVVTTDERLVSGGVPVFLAKDAEEMEKITFTLGKVLDGVVHDLGNGVYIIVSH